MYWVAVMMAIVVNLASAALSVLSIVLTMILIFKHSNGVDCNFN